MGQGAKTDPQKRACHFPWQHHSLLGKLGYTLPLLARWTVIGRRQWQQSSGLWIKVVGAKAQKTPLEDLLLNNCLLLKTQQTTAKVINLFSTGISCDVKVVMQIFPSLSTSQYLEKALSSDPSLKLLFLPWWLYDLILPGEPLLAKFSLDLTLELM